MSIAVKINCWEDLPAAIAQLELSGASHRTVLLQAVYRHTHAHVEVQRDTSTSLVKRFIATARRPALILVGDDDDEPTGPANWKQTTRLLRWARLVIVHAAAGRREEYEKALQASLFFKSVLLVETDSAHAADWLAAVADAPQNPHVWTILPKSGQHPMPVAREEML